MPKILFIASADQRERWRVLARGEETSLSEWIRRACEARARVGSGERSVLVEVSSEELEQTKLVPRAPSPRECVNATYHRPDAFCKACGQ